MNTATAADPNIVTGFRAEVPEGFARLLGPIWTAAKQVTHWPTDEVCPDCQALDALLLTLYDRAVPLYTISRAGGASRTAAYKRVQRISLQQGLGLFPEGDEAHGAMGARNRQGVGSNDYSAWIGTVGHINIPAVEKARYAQVELRRAQYNRYLTVDSRIPDQPLLITRSVPTMEFHPRDLTHWPLQTLFGPPNDSWNDGERVWVRSEVLYVENNPDSPKTAQAAIQSLDPAVQKAVLSSPLARALSKES